MKWSKKGLIYQPKLDKNSWMYTSAITPTPILLNEEVIRVYFGARDIHGVGRVGYADLNSNNPSEIIKISQDPILDIGSPGCFDDNGVILGDVVRVNNHLRMYYTAFQKVEKVKFLVFTGVAESFDNGESFVRLSKVPVIDRSDEGPFGRVIHSALFDEGIWKIWYSPVNKWDIINGIPYPNYDIRYIESQDGINFPKEGIPCIKHEGDECRLARPRVYKSSVGYEMYYTIGTLRQTYLPGRAVSSNGKDWHRIDDTVGISLSDDGWDSKTLCYLSLLKVREKTYMFYNGNDMGADGFGYAVLVEE